MHWITVNTREWVDGGHTEIRVGFTQEAVSEANLWSSPEEKLLEQCFWRFVSEHWNEVEGEGDQVEFEVDLPTIQDLIHRLPAHDASSLN